MTFTFLFLIVAIVVIALLQGKYLKIHAIRLPEADGVRECYQQGELSFLHIGESPVAGVGVTHINEGLTANIVKELTDILRTSIDWQILAANGARVTDALAFTSTIRQPDILMISFGVNDTTKFTSTQHWQTALRQCVNKFSGKNTLVCLTAVPQIQHFPLLPAPLSWLLGLKAKSLNNSLKRLCASSGWHYLCSDLPPTPQLMASDGYHPNAKGCQIWGQILSEQVIELLKKRD